VTLLLLLVLYLFLRHTRVGLAMRSSAVIQESPQAGILAGRSALVAALRRHPLARAVRMDKTGIAALAAKANELDSETS